MERYGSLAQVGELVGAAPDSRQVVDRVRRLTTHVKELQKENAVRALLTRRPRSEHPRPLVIEELTVGRCALAAGSNGRRHCDNGWRPVLLQLVTRLKGAWWMTPVQHVRCGSLTCQRTLG